MTRYDAQISQWVHSLVIITEPTSDILSPRCNKNRLYDLWLAALWGLETDQLAVERLRLGLIAGLAILDMCFD